MKSKPDSTINIYKDEKGWKVRYDGHGRGMTSLPKGTMTEAAELACE